MATRSKPDAVDANEEREGVRTLRIRIKDKHAKYLGELAREVNLVWNFVNELSIKVFQRERRFMSGYDLQKYTNGASKEGLRLHSQTIQGIAAEYAARRKQFKKVKLAWRKSGGVRRSLGWIPFKAFGVTYANGQIKYGKVWLALWDSYGLKQYDLGPGSISEDARGNWYINICATQSRSRCIKWHLPAQPGAAAKEDFEYVRQGMCVVWMFVEPLAGWRAAPVTLRKTAVDWAQQVREVLEAPRYAQAERITLVCDNLNVHRLASLYEAFAPEEALRLARKLELVHTPKHGSWLNMAEPELSVLTRQCLDQRIGQMERVSELAQKWAEARNRRQAGIDWQFRTANARIKLKYLYPKINE